MSVEPEPKPTSPVARRKNQVNPLALTAVASFTGILGYVMFWASFYVSDTSTETGVLVWLRRNLPEVAPISFLVSAGPGLAWIGIRLLTDPNWRTYPLATRMIAKLALLLFCVGWGVLFLQSLIAVLTD